MTGNKRFVRLDADEVYFITDTHKLEKNLESFIKTFSNPEYEYTEDEIKEIALEEYSEYLYENSMTGTENVNALNELWEENQRIKTTIRQLYESERTDMGKNVLKQVMEAIE